MTRTVVRPIVHGGPGTRPVNGRPGGVRSAPPGLKETCTRTLDRSRSIDLRDVYAHQDLANHWVSRTCDDGISLKDLPPFLMGTAVPAWGLNTNALDYLGAVTTPSRIARDCTDDALVNAAGRGFESLADLAHAEIYDTLVVYPIKRLDPARCGGVEAGTSKILGR